jgi:signal transduction histidine kinase/DNA-binding response OmpR family regulator
VSDTRPETGHEHQEAGPRRHGLSLAGRFAAQASALIVLVTVSIVAIVAYEEARDERAALGSHALAIATTLATDAKDAVETADPASLNALASTVDHDPVLAWALVTDRDGRTRWARLKGLDAAPPTVEPLGPAGPERVQVADGREYVVVSAPVLAESRGQASPSGSARVLGGVQVGLRTESTDRRIWASVTRVAGASLVLAMLGIGLGVVLARRLTAPVECLRQVAKDIRAGALDRRVEVEGAPDLVELAHAFNGMVDHLQWREADLAAQRRGLEAAVRERTVELSRANQQLQATVQQLRGAKEMAEGASRIKSQFLANMSHEIRTPMNGVLGLAELLLGSELTRRQRRVVQTLRRSGESLLSIINDILDFSRIEAGKLELQRSEFDLLEVVEDTVETLAARAHAKGLEIQCTVEGTLPDRVFGDAQRLRQILTNIVGNAIKFTEEGEVSVRLRTLLEARRSVLVGIDVHDTGIGIPRDAKARIFDAFAQADSSNTRRYGGTGLGLAISKQLAELMGGGIRCDSEPGQGSLFGVTARFDRREGAGCAVRRAAQWVPAGLRVLVVDDHAGSRLTLRRQCQQLGTEADVAATSEEALDRLREAERQGRPYDVVLADLRMPGRDGRELARLIRTEPGLGGVRVLLLITMDETTYWTATCPPGIHGHLVKPARLGTLAWNLSGMADQPPTLYEAETPAEATDGARLAARVLLVEDSPVNEMVARETLLHIGCEVDVAHDGQAALEALGRRAYDVVLMDCMMPGMDGFEATAELRRREAAVPSQPRSYVVAMTANAMVGDRERCLAAGMDDYLAKPFQADDLRELVRRRVAASKGPGPSARPTTPPPPAPHGPSPESARTLDASVLEKLKALERPGGPSLVARVVTTYLESSPSHLAEARKALGRGDHGVLRLAAQTLESSSGNVGAVRLSQLCRELEAGARDSVPDEAAARLAQIELEYARVREELRSLTRGAVA